MLLGIRQCGKTYIVDEFIKNEFKNYKKINLKEDTFKYYLSDVGILNNLLKIKMEDIILDKNFIYKELLLKIMLLIN